MQHQQPFVARVNFRLVEYSVRQRLWQGCPTILATRSGRLLTGWYSGGIREPSLRNYCLLAASADRGLNWQEPLLVIDGRRNTTCRRWTFSCGLTPPIAPGCSGRSGTMTSAWLDARPTRVISTPGRWFAMIRTPSNWLGASRALLRPASCAVSRLSFRMAAGCCARMTGSTTTIAIMKARTGERLSARAGLAARFRTPLMRR